MRLVRLGALFVLGVVASASAGPATDQLRVGIERVSLVANYRSQFDQIIRTASYERLVAKLKSPSS